MKTLKQIVTRDNKITEEKVEIVTVTFKGIDLEHFEYFYLDYEVDENTGTINRDKLVKHYTADQINRNLKNLKTAYNIEKGAASQDQIIEFRKSFNLSATSFSMILGYSKNTISNIENDGISSLATGRHIRSCIYDRNIFKSYIDLCDEIDQEKKDDLTKRLKSDTQNSVLEELY